MDKKNIYTDFLNDIETISEKYRDNKANEIVKEQSLILKKIKESIETKKEKYFLWYTDE